VSSVRSLSCFTRRQEAGGAGAGAVCGTCKRHDGECDAADAARHSHRPRAVRCIDVRSQRACRRRHRAARAQLQRCTEPAELDVPDARRTEHRRSKPKDSCQRRQQHAPADIVRDDGDLCLPTPAFVTVLVLEDAALKPSVQGRRTRRRCVRHCRTVTASTSRGWRVWLSHGCSVVTTCLIV
jgi:hypothetical protein